MLTDILIDFGEVAVISCTSYFGEKIMKKRNAKEDKIKLFKNVTVWGFNGYVGYKVIKYSYDIFKDWDIKELI